MFTTYNVPNDYNYDDYGLNVTYIPHSKVPYILQETTELRTQNYNFLLNRTNPALHVDLQRDIVIRFVHSHIYLIQMNIYVHILSHCLLKYIFTNQSTCTINNYDL